MKERTEHAAERRARPGNWLKKDLQEARDLVNALPKTAAKGAIARGKVFHAIKSGRTCDRKGLLAYSVFVVVLLCSTSCSVPGPPCCDWSEIQVASEIDNRRLCDVLNPRPFCSKHPLQYNCSQACLCWKKHGRKGWLPYRSLHTRED